MNRWIEELPRGLELDEVSAMLAEDLPGEEDLRDLAGGGWRPEISELFEHRAHVPRIRPILVALSARSAGAPSVDRNVQYVAELLHLALVVHDLALGREGGRRRSVARRLVKRSVSWLGGNHLTLRALELGRHHAEPELFGELIEVLREFSEGHALTRELQRGGMPTEQDWLDHADACTGALFAFCCRAGGHAAGSDPAFRSALGRYGRHVGRLWHIAEDVSRLLHDSPAEHLVHRALAGRPVLPVILASRENPAVAEAWTRLIRRPSRRSAEPLVVDLERAGGIGKAREVMLRESWAARKALRGLPDSRYRRGMEGLALTLVRPEG